MTPSGPIDVGKAPPETVLEPATARIEQELDAALRVPAERRRDALADVVRSVPDWPEGWAALAEHALDDIEAYAYFRVGYHRGLDALRKAGWRGTGYVRWEHPGNRGFLRCLAGLGATAAAIGEADEAERCSTFLRQLDPSWPPPGEHVWPR